MVSSDIHSPNKTDLITVSQAHLVHEIIYPIMDSTIKKKKTYSRYSLLFNSAKVTGYSLKSPNWYGMLVLFCNISCNASSTFKAWLGNSLSDWDKTDFSAD